MTRRNDGLPKQRTKYYAAKCQQCGAQIVATRNDANLVRCRKCRQQEYSLKFASSERREAWRKAHADDHRRQCREWLKRNRSYAMANWAAYYSAKIKRMPAWADVGEIRRIYKLAGEMSQKTGTSYHVDHEIPLRGCFVSGLHVESNLQIIPAETNFSKNRKFNPLTLT